MSQSEQQSTSAVVIHLPQYTIKAPWPLPYAPLTTIFTPPTQCKDKWTLISENTDSPTTSIGQYLDLLDTNDATCLPPGYGRDVWSATFSPGIYCPSGYEIAATGTEVYTALWEKEIYHSPAERSVVCCLRGFDYTKLKDQDVCVSAYSHSTSVFTKDYVTASNQFVYTQMTEVGAGIAIGHPIHLRHNDEQFRALFTGIPTDFVNSSAKSRGLSTGAIAGIAAGCGVVGLVVIGFTIWFILRHRRRRNEQAKSEVPPPLAASSEPPSPPAAEWASKEAAVTSTRKSSRSRREQGEHSRRHHDRS
ncbi:hypothetical protein L211DRAFT_869326 [Terfezia boudieri ATCC MYA-4762]|uniref:Uncharacterized protein n=1 Tax=Terfezia boudieri ATCC MYA-4762 TaxID=1051890 RepID=A0A3N4LLI2_9PEZI|nr:hypothetical protein L211DRAFT_869326 [Terfezia boudieri ATCC MYA-4762]